MLVVQTLISQTIFEEMWKLGVNGLVFFMILTFGFLVVYAILKARSC